MQKFWVAMHSPYVEISYGPGDLVTCLVVGVVVITPISLPCRSNGGASVQGSLDMDLYKDFPSHNLTNDLKIYKDL